MDPSFDNGTPPGEPIGTIPLQAASRSRDPAPGGRSPPLSRTALRRRKSRPTLPVVTRWTDRVGRVDGRREDGHERPEDEDRGHLADGREKVKRSPVGRAEESAFEDGEWRGIAG
jgi:hypothetical protein